MRANIEDIKSSNFLLSSFYSLLKITKETNTTEVRQVLGARKSLSALGYNNVPYLILKLIGDPLFKAIALLINAY